MSLATVTLVCAETPVAGTVSDVVASIRDCQLQRVDSLSIASARATCRDSDLVLVSLAHACSESELFGFLRDRTKSESPIPVVVLTENRDPELKLRLLQMGVVECLSVPLDLPRLAFLIDVLTVRARQGQPRSVRVRRAESRLAVAAAAGSQESPSLPDGSVFASPAMLEILKQCRALAPLDTTILVTGETGTGKTRLARLIHELSPRKAKPFLTVSCGALTSSLVTSELFGHVRGAFTGADADQMGKLAAAEDGTVLLDDIDCLPLETQTRLLRALDDRVVEPVGSNRPLQLRARLIVASNRPLEKEVEAGRLRADLYYRINVANLALPSLRRQPELIQPLAEKFLADFSRCHGRQVETIAPATLALLKECPWPGNIRQLRNVIERAVVMASGNVLNVADLPEAIRSGEPTARPPAPHSKSNELDRSKSRAELDRLMDALRRQHNNRRRAAQELGISRVTLYKKMASVRVDLMPLVMPKVCAGCKRVVYTRTPPPPG